MIKISLHSMVYDGDGWVGEGVVSAADTLSTAICAVSVVSAVLIAIAAYIMILHKQQLIEYLLPLHL